MAIRNITVQLYETGGTVPIPDVSIEVWNAGGDSLVTAGISDANGQKLLLLADGTYNFKFVKSGFNFSPSVVVISAAATVTIYGTAIAFSGLTTYADVKEFLKVGNDNDQSLLGRLVLAASDFLTTWLSRDIKSQTYTEYRNGKGHSKLMLKNYPVTAVSSLAINGVPIPLSDGQSVGYLFDERSLYLIGYTFTIGFLNVKIVYTAGYTTIPYAISQACIDLVALKYKEKDRVGVQSINLATETITYKTWDLTSQAKGMLNEYRRTTPIDQ